MTIRDIIERLASLDGDSTIYAAKPWTAGATAIVAPEPDAGGLPVEATRLGLEYFPSFPNSIWERTCRGNSIALK